jgi:hypothetical protein
MTNVVARIPITLSLPCRLAKEAEFSLPARYWEVIADNLSKGGWSSGCVSAADSRGQMIWIASIVDRYEISCNGADERVRAPAPPEILVGDANIGWQRSARCCHAARVVHRTIRTDFRWWRRKRLLAFGF